MAKSVFLFLTYYSFIRKLHKGENYIHDNKNNKGTNTT